MNTQPSKPVGVGIYVIITNSLISGREFDAIPNYSINSKAPPSYI